MKFNVGDVVERWVANQFFMAMNVTKVEGGLVYCSPDDAPEIDWTFDEATGAEVDDELRWGPAYGATGTYIKETNNGSKEQAGGGADGVVPSGPGADAD